MEDGEAKKTSGRLRQEECVGTSSVGELSWTTKGNKKGKRRKWKCQE